jgi:hypothetical protein
MRKVYPGFLQLSGFMAMNLDRHITAHREFFEHLVQGDGDSAGKHREFYDEYLAVMDLTAEFYLQTVDRCSSARAAEGRMTIAASRSILRHPPRRAAHGRGRDGRHFRRRPDQGGAPTSARTCPDDKRVPTICSRRRSLRRLQRLALPLRDRAAHLRLHASRTPTRSRSCMPARAMPFWSSVAQRRGG